jgi:hypothetical protein
MAKSTKAARGASKARSAVGSAGNNPYLRRLIEDEDLRNSVRDAFEAARDAYERLSSNGSIVDAAIDDKKVHKDLKVAAENLRDASNRIRGKREKNRLGRILLIGIAGAVLAIIISEDLRKALLDKVFGAEEEFEYTSTTTPAPAASESS